MQLKSGEIERFLRQPDSGLRLYLIYGPDTGLVTERADMLTARSGISTDDPFSLVRLDADLVASDPGRLLDEAQAISMFGGHRVVRIAGTTRKNLADSFRPLITSPPQECTIIVEAGDLKRGHALRTMFEKSPAAMAIPCYPDGPRELVGLIREEMAAAGLRIGESEISLLTGYLGGDRQATRNELRKLALYCHGQVEVTLRDIHAITGDVAAIQLTEAIDGAATGDLAGLHSCLGRVFGSGGQGDIVLLAALRHFQSLQAAGYRMASSGAEAAIAAMRPPLHFSRRNLFLQSLRLWPPTDLAGVLTRLEQSSFEARAKPDLGQSLATSALVAIAVEARNRARRSSAGPTL